MTQEPARHVDWRRFNLSHLLLVMTLIAALLAWRQDRLRLREEINEGLSRERAMLQLHEELREVNWRYRELFQRLNQLEQLELSLREAGQDTTTVRTGQIEIQYDPAEREDVLESLISERNQMLQFLQGIGHPQQDNSSRSTRVSPSVQLRARSRD